MREIKFRAWCRIDEIMYYNIQNGIDFDDGSHYGFERFLGKEEIDDYHKWDLMQYIGKKDSQNREIFEDDIIKSIYTLDDFDCQHIGIVTYDSLNTNFYSHSIKNEISRSMSGINKSIEIIGNKYENPELLKETQ